MQLRNIQKSDETIKYKNEMIDEMMKEWIETWQKTWLACYQKWQRNGLVKEIHQNFLKKEF